MRAAVTRLSRRAALAGAGAAGVLAGAARGQTLRELAEGAAGAAFRFEGGAVSTGWLPLEAGDNLILRGRLNGAATPLILDSGASVSVVDLALARRLGLQPRTARTVEDGTGRASAAIELAGVTLQLGGLTLSGLRAVALDLSHLSQAGPSTPVILGREAFEQLTVDIDLPARRVAFHAPGAFAPPAQARALPLTRSAKEGRRLPVTVEGAADIPAQFDLGSQSPLLASESFAQERGWLSGRPVSSWIGASVAGVSVERITTVRGVTLAGLELPPTPLETTVGWSLPQVPLVLGLPVLSRFRLVTDYGRDRLWLVPQTAALAAPFRRNRSGLACRPQSEALEVLHVALGSPAASGGWRVGDRIAAVDGRPARSRSGFGDGPAGETVVLTLASDETRRLTLADYF